jgi:phage-related protein
MALPTFNPSVKPSPGTAFVPVVKILAAEFGEGYSQPMPDGINNIRETVSLSWGGLTQAQMLSIINFFKARKGTQPFYYQPAGFSSPLKWTCKEWDYRLEGVWKVTAKFEQSFTAED